MAQQLRAAQQVRAHIHMMSRGRNRNAYDTIGQLKLQLQLQASVHAAGACFRARTCTVSWEPNLRILTTRTLRNRQAGARNCG
jgi:hypothetical protein